WRCAPSLGNGGGSHGKVYRNPRLLLPNGACPGAPKQQQAQAHLYLSNLDDQKFLRFSIKYLYVYKRSVVEALTTSLSKVLVEYHPFAGRLRPVGEDGEKCQVDCNGEGALLAEAYVDLTAEEFLQGCGRPNRSWRKLLYRVEAQSFLDVPPLVVQFLHAWALLTAKPDANLPVNAFHDRCILKPRVPPEIAFSHPEFSSPPAQDSNLGDLFQFLLAQPLVPVSLTFTPSQILRLKKRSVPSIKCTSFEVLASHVWRAWIKSLDPPASLRIKLLFSMNVRGRLKPELPGGYYGNGFVLACAETSVEELVTSNAHHGIKLVQEAKKSVTGEYVMSMIDLLEERRVKPDLSSSLVISSWTKLGLEELDFGGGRPLHMGPLASEIYCLFLPVIGDLHAFTMIMSVPQEIEDRFQQYCRRGLDDDTEKGGITEKGASGYS
ncbi:Transferase family, partial [Musa troglodytarum]